MRSDFDYAPYYRSTVGFDRLFDLLDTVDNQNGGGYPPYNIEKVGGDAYRIVMAVAGFGEGDLGIVQKETELVVSGQAARGVALGSDAPGGPEEPEYLHRGIAGRDFERRFQLADHVKVTGARLSNGLLSIELRREVPEEKKPRAIPIAAGEGRQTIVQQ